MKITRHAVSYLIAVMFVVALSLLPAATLWADTMEEVAPSPPAIAMVQSTYGKLPLSFEANQGQVDEQVRFLARGTGYTLFLTPSESVLVLRQREPTTKTAQRERGKPIARPEPPAIKQAVVRMTLEGANPTPTVEGMEPLPGIVNYFIGNDPAKWRTNIPTYSKVQYQEVYPGIDLAYYGNQGTVEYDFIVAPGADPAQIRLAFEGASDIHVADSGDLLLPTELGEVRVQKPLVYQLDQDGHKTLVAGHYLVERATAEGHPNPQQPAGPQVSIQLAAYDRTQPLIIDPVLLYSTYLGGSEYESGRGIAVDGSGQAYVTGLTYSGNFPTLHASQPASGGEGYGDAFVTKLTATGALAYSTYLGGSDVEQGLGIAVDGSGQAYVTGYTISGDFPTLQASQPAFGGGYADAFVTKITSTSLVNDLVTLVPVPSTYRTTADPTGCPSGFVGTFSFHAWLTNKTSSPPLSDLAVHVKALSNGNLLQNANGGTGGVGSTFTVPKNHGYTDGILSRGEFVDVHFSICLKDRKPLTFFVDVLGMRQE